MKADEKTNQRKESYVESQLDVELNKIDEEDLDFINDSRKALLARTTPFAKMTLYILITVVLVGLFWAKFAKLDEVTRGFGKVVPVSQNQVIQNLEGGILSNLLVKEGDEVKKGQVLARLDDTRFASQYRQGHKRYMSLLASIARLEAETKNNKGIIFPKEVKDKDIIEQEKNLFNSKMNLLNNTLKNLQRSYELARKELDITEPLVKEGAMSKIDLLRIKREVKSIETKMDAYKDEFYGSELAELSKNRESASIVLENLSDLKDRMDRTTLRSPINGVIKQIYINTIGGVVEPSRPIMDIVPINDKLIIEAHVKPSDIAFIKRGQKAKVKVTAYDFSIYGGLDAVVTHISADTSVNQNGIGYYEVTVETNKTYLGKKEGSLPIMPGMIASVDIITGKKPVLNYLLKPLIKAKEKAMRER